MKDDYLWDKTGQPDPEIQKLEEILGTLRYQPRPLELPVSRRKHYLPLFAIAASLLLALIAGSIWFRVRNRSVPPPQQAQVATPSRVDETRSEPETTTPEVIRDKSKNTIAVNRPRHKPVSSALSQQEREEALLAKEQLMLALRVTTEKLNLIHRKTQNTTPASQIKNQHRVG